MTTLARSVLLSLVLLIPGSAALAAAPDSLAQRFVSLDGDRLEFLDGSSGTNAGEAFQYTYETVSTLTATLAVSYPSSGRQRNVTLNFLADGSPASYSQFDFTPTNPPTPPIFRSGSFVIGDLEVAPPPPPLESSAPSSLVGLFLEAGGIRYEFLTAEKGRRYRPGSSERFTYAYRVTGETSAAVEMSDEGSEESVELLLVFDTEGEPVSFALADLSGGFDIGTNRNLADLMIGTDGTDLRGDDYYRSIGRHQTAAKLSRSMDTIVFPFVVENDGDLDAFDLRATRGRGNFRVAYFRAADRENVTAALVAGTLRTEELAHRGTAAFTMEVSPQRRLGAFLGRVEARSVSVEEARDAVHALALVKAARTKSSFRRVAAAKGASSGKPRR